MDYIRFSNALSDTDSCLAFLGWNGSILPKMIILLITYLAYHNIYGYFVCPLRVGLFISYMYTHCIINLIVGYARYRPRLYDHKLTFFITMFHTIRMVNAMPAGMNRPDYMYSQETIYNDKLDDVGFNLIWDGIAIFFFNRKFLIPLLNALGNITNDGYTLKDTAMGIDAGGANGLIVPPGAVLGNVNGQAQVHANDAQMRQHSTRVRRIFSIIMSHIDRQCHVYHELERDYANMGLHAIAYLRANGPKPLPEHQITKMQTIWQMTTADKMGLAYDHRTFWRFYNFLVRMAEDFPVPKTNADICQKILHGAPSHVSAFVDPQLVNITYRVPNFYIAPHPLANQPHPQAGQVDPKGLVRDLQKLWDSKIAKGEIAPREDVDTPEARAFFTYDIEIDTNDHETANAAFGKGKGKGAPRYGGRGGGGRGGGGGTAPVEFNERTKCYKCGGLGHIARYKRGEQWIECATRVDIPRKILDGITYAHMPARANAAEEAGPSGADADADAADESSNMVVDGAWWL